MNVYLGYVFGSVVLDIIANIFLEMSKGFKHKVWGTLAVLFIMGAFVLLALAVKGIDLFVAYTIWGTLSIIGTALATRVLFQHRIHLVSWFGLAILIFSILLMNAASTLPAA
ncbi:multidrug transporter subunit MdtI [Thiomicrorhabdus sp. 6S2-11]|uniref:Spermidine export protein MdtI n=1 Tax=Thiomicrorhabdus marina TaxID=2818442 RepID=A0ABS3Q280_9GAMM|nr:SMR family transporter [Thiomicrorhabdus marina]MBO1926429.1 multidrug transporter subunit MdtI [Thiomicrorhabdus marina]